MQSDYPIRVRGDLDPAVSRWLWIVKWFLAIPHWIILIVLFVARAVVTVIAFFAILFTGTYPRALFEFSVGVIRWAWRVNFYAVVLGTDKYPPFTLSSDPDYPADIEADYPERLSRGLVLVKWWLLAIPHFFVLTVLFGAGDFFWRHHWHHGHHHHWHHHHMMSDQQTGFVHHLHHLHHLWCCLVHCLVATSFSLGVVGIALVIVALGLLFGDRYSPGLFDFLLGAARWKIRVIGYISLLRDEYPPFRLDQGAREPVAVAAKPPETTE